MTQCPCMHGCGETPGSSSGAVVAKASGDAVAPVPLPVTDPSKALTAGLTAMQATPTAHPVVLPPGGAGPDGAERPEPVGTTLPLFSVAQSNAASPARIVHSTQKSTTTLVGVRNAISTRLLALAREMRTPAAPVRCSGFVLLALTHNCRPCIWIGGKRIDLVSKYLPVFNDACKRECAVDAIACQVREESAGRTELAPLS